jgi:CheY-like chemotaxis protein
MPSILIVDDYEMNVLIAQDILEGAGFLVATAESGASALALLAKQDFHCVLLDLHMPDMSGFELMGHIVQDPRWCALPVIGFSASRKSEDKLKALESGMKGFISKPFVAHDLLQLIMTLTDQAGYQFADISTLQANCEDDVFKLIKYLAKFKEAMALHSVELTQAWQMQDFEKISFLAHKLKSSCSFVGAQQLGANFETLEAISSADNSAQVNQLILDSMNLLKLFNLNVEYLINTDKLIRVSHTG